MSEIIKIYVGMVLVLFMTAVCAGILSVFLSVMNAQNMFDAFIDRMEYEHLDSGILENCMKEAKEQQWELHFTLFHEDGTIERCVDAETVPANTDDVEMAKVELICPYQVGSYRMEKTLALTGYAR